MHARLADASHRLLFVGGGLLDRLACCASVRGNCRELHRVLWLVTRANERSVSARCFTMTSSAAFFSPTGRHGTAHLGLLQRSKRGLLPEDGTSLLEFS
jgi:hypothetical protein